MEQLDISFSNGLTIITGESGAGKSILLGALNLPLGERARSDTVRPGASKADISAEFVLHPTSPIQRKLLDDELIDPDADTCPLRRVISARAVPSLHKCSTGHFNYLKDVGDALVEIQGQNEHQRLGTVTCSARFDDYANQGAQQKLLHRLEDHRTPLHELQQRVTTQDDRKELLLSTARVPYRQSTSQRTRATGKRAKRLPRHSRFCTH